MLKIENISTGEFLNGEELEFFVDDDTLIGEVFLDGDLIFQSLDTLDEDQLELEFYKEFIIDEFQIIEAKAHGASVILLIASCLTPAETKLLAGTAKELGMEVLLELHDETELVHICDEVDFVGINNRSLKSFEVNIEHSLKLKNMLPKEKLSIAESGIYDLATFQLLKKEGFDGFLMGEYFMKQTDPAKAFELFVSQIKSSSNAI